MRIFLRLAIVGLAMRLASSECPNISEEPIMYPYDESLFMCADAYEAPGDADAIQACNTCSEDGIEWGQFYEYNGLEDPGQAGYFYAFGSVIVMPGCTFYGFENENYGGAVREYVGPVTVPYIEQLGGANYDTLCGQNIYGFGSLKCRCIQELIDCTAYDDLSLVISCANDSGVPVSCIYTETIGTAYTESAETSRSVSQEVSEEIEHGLFDSFSTTVGISVTTGFDWTTAESATFQKEVSTTIEFELPPGETVDVYQVVGFCDGNESRARSYYFDNGTTLTHYSTYNGELIQVEMDDFAKLDFEEKKVRKSVKKPAVPKQLRRLPKKTPVS